MLTVSLVPPNESDLIATSQTSLSAAGNVAIATAEDYTGAARQLTAIKARLKELDDERKSIVRPLDEARQKIQDLYRRPMAMLSQGEAILKEMMLRWQSDEAKRQAARQMAIDDVARKERARLAEQAAAAAAKAREQAEAVRRQAEAAEVARQRAQAEGDARAAAAAAARNAKLSEKADSIEAAGLERSQELQTISDLVVAPTVASEVPTISGQTSAKTWRGRVVDLDAFIQGIAASPLPLQHSSFLDVNEGALNRFGAATAGRVRLAGVEWFEVMQLRARAGRGM